ncbi:hypothetical protein QBC39DRAFT_258406 [Podospora conica]|nr:hypothetical protein QBC39DRAFT_258406 [Schizothecium conicum]
MTSLSCLQPTTPASVVAHEAPAFPKPTLLTLPVEIRHEVLCYLLVLHPSCPNTRYDPACPRIHPAILLACRQTYAESLPILYTFNMFMRYDGCPRLRPWYPDISTRPPHKITRWFLVVELHKPSPSRAELAEVFDGARELVLMLSTTAKFLYGGSGKRALAGFEGVRGVREVEFRGGLEKGGWERYLGWLKMMMMQERKEGGGDDDEEYVCEDERERISLFGPRGGLTGEEYEALIRSLL